MRTFAKILIVCVIITLVPLSSFAETVTIKEYENFSINKTTNPMTGKVVYSMDMFMYRDGDRSSIYLTFMYHRMFVVAPGNMFNWDPPSIIKFRVDEGKVHVLNLSFNEGDYEYGMVAARTSDEMDNLIAEMMYGKKLVIEVTMLFEGTRWVTYNLNSFKDMLKLYIHSEESEARD